MIYTVTFNPALDYIMSLDGISVGNVNRSRGETVTYGGKGINVSVVLHRLGAENTALGFIAGNTGDMLERMVNAAGVSSDFIKLESGDTRINVKLRTDTVTEINAQGPEISDTAIDALYARLDRLRDGDTLVLAGSVPPTMPDDIYENILQRLIGKGIRFAVDTTGSLLINTLKYKPFVIKPNDLELEEATGIKLDSREDIINAAEKLHTLGARNVLVSMGAQGAMLYDENKQAHFCPAPSGDVINTVGAGDSMLAGFIAGYNETKDYDTALRLGIAAGSATAFSAGLAVKEDITRLYNKLKK
ncbi:MAG: 1-phosphofructokinase [Eubacterium sp.]|nr:1-phosphofructokinase [Eubacterium sp.]